MKYLATLVLLSMAALLTVGFMTVPEENHHAKADCVIASLDSACSTTNKNMAVHHIGAYNSFTNVLISIFSLISLAVVFVAFACFACLNSSLVPVRISETFTPQRTNLRRWLSRFINSPTFE